MQAGNVKANGTLQYETAIIKSFIFYYVIGSTGFIYLKLHFVDINPLPPSFYTSIIETKISFPIKVLAPGSLRITFGGYGLVAFWTAPFRSKFGIAGFKAKLLHNVSFKL